MLLVKTLVLVIFHLMRVVCQSKRRIHDLPLLLDEQDNRLCGRQFGLPFKVLREMTDPGLGWHLDLQFVLVDFSSNFHEFIAVLVHLLIIIMRVYS